MIAFDDGPLDVTTAELLDILAFHEERAAFFVVGERIAGREDLLRRMVADGHEVGNHGWSHTAAEALTLGQFEDELVDTHRAIVAACGAAPGRYRPPFRRIPQPHLAVAESMYAAVELESSVGDYALDGDGIAEFAALVPPGRTVWLHDGVAATVEALPTILAARAALALVLELA